MRVEIATITPEWADEVLLNRNTSNVPLRDATCSRYTREMENGKWVVTGEAFIFDTDGILVSGQHRLKACVRSGKSLQNSVIVYGVPPEARRVVDTHRIRQLTDSALALGISALTDKRISTVILPMMRGYAKQTGAPTITEKFEFWERHSTAILFATTALPEIRLIARGPVYAAIARAHYHEAPARLEEFGHVLYSGMPKGPEDQSAILLRDHLMKYPSAGGSQQAIGYRKTSRALYGFCRKEQLKKLYEASEELYRLPEEHEAE